MKSFFNFVNYSAEDDNDVGPYYANFTANTTSATVCINITSVNITGGTETFTVYIVDKVLRSDIWNTTVSVMDYCK